ncbi:MAG: CHASE2 domain-containing protein [Fidelibacterota bacterium]
MGWFITISAILVVSFFHWLGVFDLLEMKIYDYRFYRVRGPLTGWTARDSSYFKRGTNVVLVEVDDEAWRLMPEEWPYPRGTIWARVVRNLYKAGAKVIVFDIQFDAPETKSEYLSNFVKKLDEGYILNQIPQYGDSTLAKEIKKAMPYLVPRHGDKMLGEAIAEAQAFGTKVVINVKKVTEENLQPPEYISYPVEPIMKANPEIGIINDQMDEDGFSRQYAIYDQLNHEPDKYYLTLGVKAVKAYLGISDTAKPYFDPDELTCSYGQKIIKTYGYGNTFLVNYYGPASGYKVRSKENLPAWGTFQKYSIAYIIDTEDVNLRDPTEDIDWMSQFLPGEIPEWIQAIEDPVERQEMMDVMGLGQEFDVTKSPFYNKIVLIGTTVEVHHDYKQTPFYNYMGIRQITPGLETHANAIQTIIDDNYIKVLGGRFTGLIHDYPISHTLLIALLSLIAFFILTYLNPMVAGILIIFEGIVYFGIVCGLFVDDLFWFVRVIFIKILPGSFVTNHANWFDTALPDVGQSFIIPFVAPVVGLVVTYTGNVIYKFINEQKDKRFLKSTFGAYISPELIDQMYEEKQEPKLGGVLGYHTAFFSDIQSFSSFSEVLEPERMVSLMNEYLTEMTTVLLEHKGTLDKYIGDAIVAFYGAPMPVENHEYHACMTALEMEKRLVTLREKWKSDGSWPDLVYNIRHRVGLNSGELVTGNMGSSMRMNYTMMGDTVNLAARLEPAAKQYGVYILVGENTYQAIHEQFEWRFIDYVRVKGKKKPEKVYELLAEKGELSTENADLIETFNKAMNHYHQQNWKVALKEFEKAKELEAEFLFRPTDPSAVYIQRCQYFIENPPGKDWDGVWVMTKK